MIVPILIFIAIFTAILALFIMLHRDSNIEVRSMQYYDDVTYQNERFYGTLKDGTPYSYQSLKGDENSHDRNCHT